MKYGKVTSVLFDKYKEYDGLVIETQKQTIEVLISNEQLCCEEWGVSFDEQEFYIDESDEAPWEVNQNRIVEKLMWRTIDHVKWNPGREKEKNSTGKPYACIDIYSGDTIFPIDVWCQHNGYYPHTLRTKWCNHVDEQTM